ncbi:type I-D CRISPR-associated protein Cas7/Csc2 [Anabaena sp. UHCC 0451]|uniref:type I-D CRISPR-associated protein Cas7/Csc2 n=1 Tax=Anabaena sp. UHCC 0451 TaxID=2055235 RepID=UPI002B21D04C|nr:type I-D CRISPR-associated protein Cas7/Csc2 [Anabaena sp. UHCC 0451]MEA5574895.1 type I-D CRISPR-associated protein Cas7/Csc2 [Anabaena sp. UHCC 0451]
MMSILTNGKYANFLLDRYHEYPQGKYVNLILIRKTESEAIFRTEGSGEPLCREFVNAGLQKCKTDPIQRVVITKRKQTAVERRTGREDLRKQNLLCLTDDGAIHPDSIDGYIYGYAVGQGGAQKSRVITEDAFSVLTTSQVVDTRTSNALFETGTMRDAQGKQSESLFNSEYVRPETHFLDIETLKDVTPDELFYVLGNILRSSRYGAVSSRIGKVKNTVAQVVFSDTEIFSTLELTQHVYDALLGNDKDTELDFPLADDQLLATVKNSSEELIKQIIGQYELMTDTDQNSLIEEVRNIYRKPAEFLQRLANSYKGG